LESKPILLIAEDDPDDQILIQDAVEDACLQDVETRVVWDGIELMAYLHGIAQGEGKPGLVLLDLNMPRKDGRVALREIKADPSLADIPVAVLTTSSAEVDAEYCSRFGVVGYYRKPGSMTELREIIGGLCMDYLK
jgi:CheY-like chemotaxis protein